MKKNALKILALIMALLMIAPTLFACGNTPEESKQPEESKKPEGTEAPMESESESESGEPEVKQDPLELIKDGQSNFTLVINRYAQFINDKAAYMIQDAVKAISGVELPLAKDYDLFINSLDTTTRSKYELQVAFEADGGTTNMFADRKAIEASYDKSAPYEILIGETDRPESVRAIADLKGENEYILRIDGNKIVLVASSNKALIAGAEYFVSEYLSTETANLTIEDPKKSATIEVVVDEDPVVFFGMTQTEVDEKYADILDGLFTGKTQEVIYREGLGANIWMHFPEIAYEDGTYYAYFISYASGTIGTGLATSANGFDWEYAGEVITAGEPGSFDSTGTAFAGYWKDEDGICYLTYECSGDDCKGQVALAVSFDNGETWKKEGVIYRNTKDNLVWCNVNVGTPDLYKEGDMWYLTFHGFGGETAGNNGGCQNGVAYGESLRNLTIHPTPILPTEKDTAWSGTTGRRDVFKCGEYYYMVYEISTEAVPGAGYGGANWSHMFARSKDMINWEHTEGPQLPQSSVGFGHDGTNWCVIDGELYVFMRNGANNTTAVKLVLSD